jgi:hypothetical protein
MALVMRITRDAGILQLRRHDGSAPSRRVKRSSKADLQFQGSAFCAPQIARAMSA